MPSNMDLARNLNKQKSSRNGRMINSGIQNNTSKTKSQKVQLPSFFFCLLFSARFLLNIQVPPVRLLFIALFTNYFTLILYKCFDLRQTLRFRVLHFYINLIIGLDFLLAYRALWRDFEHDLHLGFKYVFLARKFHKIDNLTSISFVATGVKSSATGIIFIPIGISVA